MHLMLLGTEVAIDFLPVRMNYAEVGGGGGWRWPDGEVWVDGGECP